MVNLLFTIGKDLLRSSPLGKKDNIYYILWLTIVCLYSIISWIISRTHLTNQCHETKLICFMYEFFVVNGRVLYTNCSKSYLIISSSSFFLDLLTGMITPAISKPSTPSLLTLSRFTAYERCVLKNLLEGS